MLLAATVSSVRAIRFRLATTRYSTLNRGSFFVIVPGGDQDERDGMRRVIVLLEQA